MSVNLGSHRPSWAIILLAITAAVFTIWPVDASAQANVEDLLSIADQAAQSAGNQPIDAQAVVRNDGSADYLAYRQTLETNKFWLLITILGTTPIVLLVVLIFVRMTSGDSPENIVTATGLVLVINGTSFITVFAATSEQLTAPIGILGAIAGYLFGQATRREPARPPS